MRALALAGILGGLGLVGLLSACGSSSGGPNSPSRPLPAYAGRSATLFDDTIEPAGVGLDFQKGYQPRHDPLVRERSQTSDAVIRVRVSTVTAKKDGPEVVYQLGLHTVEKVAGENPPETDFTVQITKSSESLGIMKNFESRLVGYPFVAFVREFVRPDGDREIHFHLAPDTKDVKVAVSDALALGELK
ncbi:hypothetical protein AKJ09_08138 [Labilithrix luteola]|uniref:Lipoprotein n=2 Tax=Labilithrix luteola TaxID=1391654 RepID=A0A0K1Q7T5_9BACT|nr:hypothetical protein AKJ09_08138 [Labilithrix luteola]